MSLQQRQELVGRMFALRPITQIDYPMLYQLLTTPPTSTTWRYHGMVPSPESFPGVLWNGVLAQFAIVDRRIADSPVGLVQAIDHDAMNRVVYFAVAVHPGARENTTAMAEGTVLFLMYLFRHFDIRKVYAETTQIAVNRLGRIVESWSCVREEGRLRDHVFLDDAHHDLVILAISRSDFDEELHRLSQVVGYEPRREATNVPSFEEFTASLPRSILPEVDSHGPLVGGSRLNEDLGMDSLGLIELICWAEQAFGAVLDEGAWTNLSTLQDFYAEIERSVSSITR